MLKTMDEIRQTIKESGDPVNCIAAQQFCTSPLQDCMQVTVMDDQPMPEIKLCTCQAHWGRCLPMHKQLLFGPEALWTYVLHFTCWPHGGYFDSTAAAAAGRPQNAARPDQAIIYGRTGLIFPNGTLVTPKYRMRQGKRLPDGRAMNQDHKFVV
uniref:Uncharacterized protein n=1 Tax=Romanomermis culicivorax TaxID=13658 RepID=A0A915JUQ7_ROMCU